MYFQAKEENKMVELNEAEKAIESATPYLDINNSLHQAHSQALFLKSIAISLNEMNKRQEEEWQERKKVIERKKH